MPALFINEDALKFSTLAIAGWVGNPFKAFDLIGSVNQAAQPFKGNSTIGGKIRRISTPDPSDVVRLYHKGSGVLVAETVSDANGDYLFSGLDPLQEYYVISIDDLSFYDPVISSIVDLDA